MSATTVRVSDELAQSLRAVRSPQMPEPLSAALTTALEVWLETLGPSLVSLALFGSAARGDATPESDLDLLVIASGWPHSLASRRRPLFDAWESVRAERGLAAVEWNLITKTPEEAQHRSPLYLDMTEDAVLLIDRGGFFEAVLDGLRARMRELGSRRVRMNDGSWYWDLKPDARFGDEIEL